MRVLVTGADGFVGSHIVQALAVAGHDVVRAVYARPAARVDEVWIDLCDRSQLARLPTDVEAVVHAAGSVDTQRSASHLYAANVHTTENLLRWSLSHALSHFVQISSVAVYGPLVVGEDRAETTPRLGRLLGLPYMRTKARAERIIEDSGVPYTLLRPPAILGRGDTVLSRGFVDALCGAGIPLLPGASLERRVSLVFAEGLAEIVRLSLAHGPLNSALHALDVELSVGALAAHFAGRLGRPCTVAPTTVQQAISNRDRAGISWLIASTRFGQHYRPGRLLTELGYRSRVTLESAVESGLSSLQGGTEGLF